jgi:hypothetical protein
VSDENDGRDCVWGVLGVMSSKGRRFEHHVLLPYQRESWYRVLHVVYPS